MLVFRMNYSYVVFIDESGDDGLAQVKPLDPNGSSEWLILSAVVILSKNEMDVGGWIKETEKKFKNHQRAGIYFKDLNPAKKRTACQDLAEKPVRLFIVASNKKNMKKYENLNAAKILSRNWFYCWLSRMLLEKVTHFIHSDSLKRFKEVKKAKVEFSARGGQSYSQMSAYYDWLKNKSIANRLFVSKGDIRWGVIDRDLLRVLPHRESPGLQFADISAGAFFKACDLYDTGSIDSEFAKILSSRFARYPNNDGGKIAGYGVKLMPKFNEAKLTNEQEKIFRHFGYPDNEWWDRETIQRHRKVVLNGPF